MTALRPTFVHAAAPVPVAGSGSVRGETHPGISLEPMYSEAVIAYNSKQPTEALKVLDALLRIKPDHLKALELKALVLKSAGKPEESRANYEALIKNAPREKAGPYHFELGIIEHNAKKPDAAVPHFEESLAQGFNVDTSHFFLGLIAFNQAGKIGQLGKAERHFSAVTEGKTPELKSPAYYYLGLIAYKNNQGTEGTHQLIEARNAARSMPADNAIAKDIEKAVNAILAPYGKAQWFGNVSVLGAYNSNAGTFPNTADTVAQQASDISTFQTMLVAGIGRMGSPLDRLQTVVSYRATANINTEANTSRYQFFTNTGSLYLTLDPLARTQYGLKSEGVLSFNQPTSGSFSYSPYSLSGEFGPYVRRQMGNGTTLSVEAFYRPSHFFGDDDTAETVNDLSGYANWGVRTAVQRDTGHSWWNPSWTVSLDRNNTQGPTFRAWALNTGLFNVMRPTGNDTVSAGVQMVFNNYLDASPRRFDKLVSLRLNEVHRLSQKWTLIADAGYTINYSTDPATYHYTQFTTSAGVGVSF